MKKLLILAIAIHLATICFSQTTEEITEKFGITISLPIVNKIQYYDHYFEKNAYRTRYGGFSGGGYYRLGDDKISLIGGTAIASHKPIYDLTKDLETGPGAHNVNLLFLDAIYHKRLFKMINGLGGLNLSNYKYDYYPINDSKRIVYKDKALGLLVGAEFQPFHFLSTSVIYRPTIVSFDQKAPYHYISFDLRFHIPFYSRPQMIRLKEIGEANKEEFRKNRPRLPFQKKVK